MEVDVQRPYRKDVSSSSWGILAHNRQRTTTDSNNIAVTKIPATIIALLFTEDEGALPEFGDFDEGCDGAYEGGDRLAELQPAPSVLLQGQPTKQVVMESGTAAVLVREEAVIAAGWIANEEEQGTKMPWVAGRKESAEEKMAAIDAAETTGAAMMMMKPAEMVETILGRR
nr:hypothetical protein Iba_chr07dCG5140 [Ipomoea batatas]